MEHRTTLTACPSAYPFAESTRPIRGSATSIAVGVVDDHPIVRAGLVDYLSCQSGMHVAGEADSGAGALEMIRQRRLDVLILDLDMPGRSGLDVLAMLRNKVPDVAVLIFTGFPADRYAVKLLQLGAKAYVQKTGDLAELALAIKVLAAGQRHLTPQISELLALEFDPRRRLPHAMLTERELQVLLKIAQGVRMDKIADHLALSLKTVSTYRSRLLNKLELGSNSDLTYYALKHRLLD